MDRRGHPHCTVLANELKTKYYIAATKNTSTSQSNGFCTIYSLIRLGQNNLVTHTSTVPVPLNNKLHLLMPVCFFSFILRKRSSIQMKSNTELLEVSSHTAATSNINKIFN